jgi:hypothetical protein
MNYEIRKSIKGIKRIYYKGNPIFSYLIIGVFQAAFIGLFYRYVLIKHVVYFQENRWLLYVILIVFYLYFYAKLTKNTKYIQWDDSRIIFHKINGITDTILVSTILSIKIIDSKGIDISYKNHIHEGNNGVISIPFEKLGRNFNTDVDIIKEDFKMLYAPLVIKD